MQHVGRVRRNMLFSSLAMLILLVLPAAVLSLSPWGRRWVHEFRIARQLKRLGVESYWNWRVPCVDNVAIDRVPLSEDIISLLAQLSDLRHLGIDVRSREEAAIALTGVSQLSDLEVLFIGGPITDDEVYHLTGPQTLERIEFDLSDIGDDGLKHLARFPKLRIVRAYGSRVSAAGVAELKRALPDVEVGWKEHRLTEDSYFR